MSNDKIPNRANWRFDFGEEYITKDKKELIYSAIGYMMDRCIEMFEWKGLPNDLPQEQLERFIQQYGFISVQKDDKGEVCASWSSLGGDLDRWYIPKKSIVANPYIPLTKEFDIGVDCVIIKNDLMMVGTMPLHRKYAELLAETEISLRFASINSRHHALLQADNDQAKEDASEYLKNIEMGHSIGVIGTKAFMEGTFQGVEAKDLTSSKGTNTIKDLMELEQYIKAQWFIELGLNANYNMKREAINSEESGMNDDILLPLIDQMLKERKEGCKRVNSMFGTSWSVDLSSSWKSIHENYHAEQDGIKSEEKKDGNVEATIDETEGNE